MTAEQLSPPVHRPVIPARLRAGLMEFGLIAILYVGYSASRLLASDDTLGAHRVAEALLTFERHLGLDFEDNLAGWVMDSSSVSFSFSLWYATTHYVVTAGVMLWLFLRRGEHYRSLRTSLILATALALVFYILLPTEPPRLFGPQYPDVLAQTADLGWWGAEASAPQGLGGLTNQLAAFPSMHAGWALWVALALIQATSSRLLHLAGGLYAAITAVVVIGTGNHWTVDVLAGCAIVFVAWFGCRAITSGRSHVPRQTLPQVPLDDR